MPIRCTSADAYRRICDNGRSDQTTAMIIAALKRHPAGLTRREIEDETGLRVNQVAGRVRELLDQGRAKEINRRPCRITGNIVNVVTLSHVSTIDDASEANMSSDGEFC